MKLICLAIPWLALGPASLFSDSGMLFLYEPLVWMYKKFGMRSFIYLHPDYRDAFESTNKVEDTGVQGVYATHQRVRRRQRDTAVDCAIANDYIMGYKCPIDLIYTNKKMTVPHLVTQAEDFVRRGPLPVVFHPLVAGIDGEKKAVVRGRGMETSVEAAGYMMSDYIFWMSQESVERGLSICRTYLSPSVCQSVRSKYSVLGGNLLPLIKKYAPSDAEVRTHLQRKKRDFRVSFVGRMAGNKNPDFILGTMKTMFAKFNIGLEIVSTGSLLLPENYTKFKDKRDARNVIVAHETGGVKGREYYASKILPSIQCLLYASLTEGYAAVPREVVYAGAPVLLPRRKWATTMFFEEYPFYYSDMSEAVALIKRIKTGRITDDECSRFNRCRHNKKSIMFADEMSEKMYSIFHELVEPRVKDYQQLNSSTRVVEAFLSEYSVGAEFTWSEVLKVLKKKYKFSMGEGWGQHRTVPLLSMYRYTHEMIECVDHTKGVFKRIK